MKQKNLKSERMRKKRMHGRISNQWILALYLILSLSGIHGAAAYPVKFTLSQVHVCLPEIKVYAGLTDENGTPMDSPSADDLIIKLDGRAIPIREVSPFKETGEGVAYTLLTDVSKTMAGAPFRNAVSAITALVSNMSEKDRIAVITFGDDVTIISDFTNDRDELISALGRIQPNHNNTHFYAGVSKAFDLNKRQDPTLPTRRAILVISDGKDEGSGITIEDLIEQNNEGIPIYSIGYSKIDPKYLDPLKRLSVLSGGHFLRSRDAREFTDIYQKTFGDIRSQFVIKTAAASEKADGIPRQIYVAYSKDEYRISAEKTAHFIHTLPEYGAKQREQMTRIYISVAALSVFLIIALFLWLLFRKRKAAQKEIPDSGSADSLLYDGAGSPHTPAPGETPPDMKSDETRGPVIRLIIIKGREEGKEYRITVDRKGRTLGKAGADVLVDDQGISDIHCVISWKHDRLMIRDEGSEKGTFHNGIPVKTRDVIEDGDTIRIGECTLRIKEVKSS